MTRSEGAALLDLRLIRKSERVKPRSRQRHDAPLDEIVTLDDRAAARAATRIAQGELNQLEESADQGAAQGDVIGRMRESATVGERDDSAGGLRRSST